MSSREFQERLTRRARRAGLTIRPELGAQLEIYYRLLSTWNKKINLTGLNLSRFRPESLDRLLIEPLVAASHVRPAVRSLLDVGSGGGSPAIPLALALTRRHHADGRGQDAEVRLSSRGVSSPRPHPGRCCHRSVRGATGKATATRGARSPDYSSRANRVARADESAGLRATRWRDLSVSNVSRCPGPATVTPPLAWKASYPLLEQASSLVVLEKRQIG